MAWIGKTDLATFRLLEPACGDGAVLVPAARRLFRSAKARCLQADEERLAACILGYEIDANTVEAARERIATALVKEGARRSLARRLATTWVRSGDFLLQRLDPTFTHVATNPPYLRWSRIPMRLRQLYEREVPRYAARGGISLAFLQRSLALLAESGTCAFLFPDRWLRSKYGEEFRADMAGKATLIAHIEAHGLPVFAGTRKVETYPAVSVFKVGSTRIREAAFHRPVDLATLSRLCRDLGAARLRTEAVSAASMPAPSLGRAGGAMLWDREAQVLVAGICERFPTLSEAGIVVRCGTALGVAKAFVLDDPSVVEAERAVPFVKSADIGIDGAVVPSAWLANPWDAAGSLVDLNRFPLLAHRLGRYREALEARACVRHDGEWYRTIDKVRPEAIAADKVIIAGLADRARIGLSKTPCQPGNALYKMRSGVWPLDALARLLRTGVTDLFAQVLAPRMRNGSMRFDGYFLSQLRVPTWDRLGEDQRKALVDGDSSDLDLLADIYGVSSLDPGLFSDIAAKVYGRAG